MITSHMKLVLHTITNQDDDDQRKTQLHKN